MSTLTAPAKMALSKDNLRRLARSPGFFEAAKTYFQAKAFAQIERERVDAYVRPIFDRYSFPVKKDWQKLEGEFVTDPDSLYLADLDSPLMKQYEAEVAAAHRAHGWTGPEEHCPACVAEHNQLKAERALIDFACRMIDIGAEVDDIHGEHRENFLKILGEMAVLEHGKAAFMPPMPPSLVNRRPGAHSAPASSG